MIAPQTYSFVFSGETGQGFGVLHITGKSAFAVDQTNVKYRGSAIETEDGGIQVDMIASIPAGVNLVSGAAEQEIDTSRPISHKFDSELGNGKPLSIMFAGAKVIAIFKRVPNELADVPNTGFSYSFARQIWGWER